MGHFVCSQMSPFPLSNSTHVLIPNTSAKYHILYEKVPPFATTSLNISGEVTVRSQRKEKRTCWAFKRNVQRFPRFWWIGFERDVTWHEKWFFACLKRNGLCIRQDAHCREKQNTERKLHHVCSEGLGHGLVMYTYRTSHRRRRCRIQGIRRSFRSRIWQLKTIRHLRDEFRFASAHHPDRHVFS